MKKLLVALAVLLLLLWVVSWFRTPAAVATAAAKPWPGGMGTLDAVEKRFPEVEANAAAAKLAALASALPKDDVVNDFVLREGARAELTIGVPPALPDVTAMRELLLREAMVWKAEEGVGGGEEMNTLRATTLRVARALIASALVKARANDASAWEDLRAAWNLSRSLDPQPQMMLQTAAFTMTRTINAVAWKMPLPVPAWFAELQQHDDVKWLLAAFQYQAAAYWKDSSSMFPTKFFANSVDHDRQIAESLARETRCSVDAPMNELGTDLSFVWRRAFRARAEREATANAIRIREGKPIETASRCSDGGWTFDGTTLRYRQEIATAPPDRPMPLALHIQP